jgi:hypothetical protein
MKALFLVLSLFAGFSSLCGQTAVLRAHLDRDSAETDASPATLYILDAKGSRALADGFASLLQQDELRSLQVPLRVYTLGSGSERPVLATYRLESKAQWLLVGRRGAVLSRGETLPLAGNFARDLHSAGFRDRVKELRAFLKEDPQSLDAREQLIAALRQRAERTAQRYLGIQVPSMRERLERGDLAGFQREQADPTPLDLSQAKPLEPVQDLDAWGAFAQEMDGVFRNGQWREMTFSWLADGRAMDASSPTLRVIYQRWQPTVEAALRRQPESEPFWDLWLWMNQVQSSSRLSALLASLHPTPLTPKDQWPPDRVALALRRGAHTLEDWRALKELFLARWDQVPHTLRETSGGEQTPGRETSSPLFEQDWTLSLEPLLESCLRAGDTSQADSLFMEALGTSGWRALPNKAAALARRCGQSQMAARWAALRAPSH